MLVGLFNTMYVFLMKEIEIGGIEFSLWSLLGGGVLVALLTMRLIKALVPML